MLKDKERIFEVEKTKKISKEEHGRFVYYIGKFVVGVASVMIYVEMFLTMGHVRSVRQAREIIKDTEVNEWYNFGSNKFVTNNSVPEELRILRDGFWSFNNWE